MPKNNGRGGKSRRKGKGSGPMRRDIVLKDDEQEYAQVEKKEGGPYMRLKCADGVHRLGVVRGKMRKRQWMNVGDTVLVSLRDFQDDKCDIIHTYTPEEVRKLIAKGELPPQMQSERREESACEANEDCFVFVNEEDLPAQPPLGNDSESLSEELDLEAL